MAALLVWQGSQAAFSATTRNNRDRWTSGSLTLTNNGGGAAYAATTTALFNQANASPGAAGMRCLTVRKTGTAAGSLHFYRSALTDSAPSLGAQLHLTITAVPVAANVQAGCAGFPVTGLTTVATNVALTALPTSYPAATGPVAVATGTQRVAYRIAWTFVSTGTNAGDNALMGKTVSASFTWEVQ